MRRVCLPALGMIVILECGMAHATGTDWAGLAATVNKAVVYIEHEDGSCTGTVINVATADNKKRDYVLTAAHCDAEPGKPLYVDQERAAVRTKDVKNDFMVLDVPNLGRPAIRLAKADPKQGEEVMSFGYGYGLEQPMLRVTHIAIEQADIPELSGRWVVTDATFVPGQSGGPVVNAAGEIVMMVQRGSNSVGIGKGAETIKSKVGKYFQ